MNPATCPHDGMVDITDLKSVGISLAGSNPAAGTFVLKKIT